MIEARFKLDYPAFSLDVDLRLPGQGVTALFGPSGSGKTSLLRAIAGLVRAPGGRLVVAGATWQDAATFVPAHRRPIGYVFQEASLFPHLSVQGNLDYGMKRAGAAADAALSGVVELLGIGHLLGRRPESLSGGERQRVAIARALMRRPRLLLMDEPLAALDHARRQEILPYLERLHETLKIPLLYVSHAPDEVARLADHLVVLDGGRALASGPLTETLARLDLPIRLGDDAGVVIEGAVAERDERWHLARIGFAGGHFWVRDGGQPLGQRVRVRVLARDVSLCREPALKSSILNTLRGTVVELADEPHPALTLVKVAVGDAPLIARVTRRSASALELRPGEPVWVQVKSVALVG